MTVYQFDKPIYLRHISRIIPKENIVNQLPNSVPEADDCSQKNVVVYPISIIRIHTTSRAIFTYYS